MSHSSNRKITAALAAVAVAGGLSLAAGTASAGNVAWSVSVGGPGYALTAGAPGYRGYPYWGGYYGRPYVPVARPYYRPYYPVVVAPPVVYPAGRLSGALLRSSEGRDRAGWRAY